MSRDAPLQAVIFDFDLTLVDSTHAVSACIAHALDQLGFDPAPPEAVRRTIGLSLEATLEVLTGTTDPRIQGRFRDRFVQRANLVMVARSELFAGVLSALTVLRDRGLRLAIVSTKHRCRIEAILDRQGARHLFKMIVGGEDTSAPKPDPEGLDHSLTGLRIGPHEAVYVGDHPVDAEAAMRGAVPFVPVLTGETRQTEFLRFPHVGMLGSVAELPAFLSDAVVLTADGVPGLVAAGGLLVVWPQAASAPDGAAAPGARGD